jgi:putative SOS response-associated peptidase YedK
MIRVLLLATLAIWSRNVLCGRFNLTKPKDVIERFGFLDWSEKRIQPHFNIAPSQEIVTIVQEPSGKPTLQMAVWGLKPFWLEPGRAPPINARAESVAASPMFREASRCLIPATGFYEWRNRQPMHIQLKRGAVFAFAGLWLPGIRGGLPTAAIVTTRPNALMATIHNRMPAILRRGDERAWLDLSAADVERCLEPIEADQMDAYPVSPLVNSWENEGSELIAPSRSPTEVQMALPLDPA